MFLPVLWGCEELAGEDGGEAGWWLKGTGAWRDLRRKDEEGMSLVSVASHVGAREEDALVQREGEMLLQRRKGEECMLMRHRTI